MSIGKPHALRRWWPILRCQCCRRLVVSDSLSERCVILQYQAAIVQASPDSGEPLSFVRNKLERVASHCSELGILFRRDLDDAVLDAAARHMLERFGDILEGLHVGEERHLENCLAEGWLQVTSEECCGERLETVWLKFKGVWLKFE